MVVQLQGGMLMPVNFLTPEQVARYGRYHGEPDTAQLDRYFYLDDRDRLFLALRRGDPARLGCALQLCTVRFLGTFLADPTDVPPGVLTYVANQLQVEDPSCIMHYRTSEQRWRHTTAICRHYGYRDFSDQPGHFHFVRWLATRAWIKAERPIVLFDLATAWLVQQKILLPGATTLEKLVARVRERMTLRLWRLLAQLPNAAQRANLERLWHIPPGARTSLLDQVRRPPTRVSAPALIAALKRYTTIRDLGVGELRLAHIPAARLNELARYAASARAQALAHLAEDRRIATLLAFARVFEATAQDDALTILDQLIDDVLAKAVKTEQQVRLRTIKDLDAAALTLSQVCAVVLDPTCTDAEVRERAFTAVSREQLTTALSTVQTLTRPPENSYYQDLLGRYGHVRRFLPTLLRTICFQGTAAGQPVLEALRYLMSIEGQARPDLRAAPRAIITRAWRRYVDDPLDSVDRRYYTLCVLEQLQRRLDRRDIFVAPSTRWGDPRAKLLQGRAWEVKRPHICRALLRSAHPAPELEHLAETLDTAYRRVEENLPSNTAVMLEDGPDGVQINLKQFDKLNEPDSLVVLRDQCAKLLPRVDLADVIMEIQAVTRFADEFTHISEVGSRVVDLPLSICAVLLAEACNLPFESVVHPAVPALQRDRLAWVHQNYIRIETITRANARLVDYQSQIPLARQWGGGDVASADGLRFVVPVRTIHAGRSSKYFPATRGITYYSLASDQYTGLHGVVLPGTVAEGPALLACVVEQQTSLRPIQIMTDAAAYSDVLFGLFYLLGYQFSPRLGDLGETRFWRIDPTADYGRLNTLARHQIDLRVITAHWDDLLRLVGSLTLGAIDAWDLMRLLQGENRATTLARAVGMLGRIAKTLHLLTFLDDAAYRRRILTHLNRGETRHSLARTIFHGQKGEVRQRYQAGQEDQLGALGFIVNVVVLWNTRYLQVALHYLQQQGKPCAAADVARLSPLRFEHIHLNGRHRFMLDEAVKGGGLRPLNLTEQEHA
jgi:TnpA family transposase